MRRGVADCPRPQPQQGIRPAAVADRSAVQGQRARTDADAVRVLVLRSHRIAKDDEVPARIRGLVGRMAVDAPNGQRQTRLPRDRSRLGEGDLGLDDLSDVVAVAAGRRADDVHGLHRHRRRH